MDSQESTSDFPCRSLKVSTPQLRKLKRQGRHLKKEWQMFLPKLLRGTVSQLASKPPSRSRKWGLICTCGELRGMPSALCPCFLHYSSETGFLTEPGAILVVRKPQQSLDPPHTVFKQGFFIWMLRFGGPRSPRVSNKCSSLLNHAPSIHTREKTAAWRRLGK